MWCCLNFHCKLVARTAKERLNGDCCCKKFFVSGDLNKIVYKNELEYQQSLYKSSLTEVFYKIDVL